MDMNPGDVPEVTIDGGNGVRQEEEEDVEEEEDGEEGQAEDVEGATGDDDTSPCRKQAVIKNEVDDTPTNPAGGERADERVGEVEDPEEPMRKNEAVGSAQSMCPNSVEAENGGPNDLSRSTFCPSESGKDLPHLIMNSMNPDNRVPEARASQNRSQAKGRKTTEVKGIMVPREIPNSVDLPVDWKGARPKEATKAPTQVEDIPPEQRRFTRVPLKESPGDHRQKLYRELSVQETPNRNLSETQCQQMSQEDRTENFHLNERNPGPYLEQQMRNMHEAPEDAAVSNTNRVYAHQDANALYGGQIRARPGTANGQQSESAAPNIFPDDVNDRFRFPEDDPSQT